MENRSDLNVYHSNCGPLDLDGGPTFCEGMRVTRQLNQKRGQYEKENADSFCPVLTTPGLWTLCSGCLEGRQPHIGSGSRRRLGRGGGGLAVAYKLPSVRQATPATSTVAHLLSPSYASAFGLNRPRDFTPSHQAKTKHQGRTISAYHHVLTSVGIQ